MILCVTGMHRSGTSLVASWFDQQGVRMSDDEDVEAGIGNEKGHFEDRKFRQVASRAIAREVPDSDGWRLTDPTPPRLRFEAREVRYLWGRARLRRRQANPWGWKDPRAALFLGSLMWMFPTMHVLALWRPAELVVDSLLRRSQRANRPGLMIDDAAAVATWLAYNQAVLDAARKHRRRITVVPLETLLTLSQPGTDALLARLGLAPVPPLASFFEPERLRVGTSGEGLGREALAVHADAIVTVTRRLEQASWH